jgi:hypothetical protein
MFFMIAVRIVVSLSGVLRWTLQDTGVHQEKTLCHEKNPGCIRKTGTVLETKTWFGSCVSVGPKAGVNRKVDIELDKERLKLDARLENVWAEVSV